jgi:hypothetical protein
MSSITPLYYANQFVDTVQNAKNQFLKTFVTDEKVRAPLVDFVEAQREFTKQINRSAQELADQTITLTKNLVEKTKTVAGV